MKVLMMTVSVAAWFALNPTSALACPACDESKTTATSESKQSIPTLTPSEVHARMLANDITVIDANPVDIFEREHVPGARRVEYDQVKAADLPTDKTAPVVFYCMNERCGASPIAAARARALGWSNVYLMPAGIQGWVSARLPVQTGDQRSHVQGAH